ncbi:MAG: MMOB1640 family gliding machinery internal complex protein [Metamycoplasmataceae bacterium]
MIRDLVLTTSTNPENLLKIFDEEKDEIFKVVILTLDYKPIELFNKKNDNTKKEKQDIKISSFDVAALVIHIVSKNNEDKVDAIEKEKIKFVMAQDIVRVKTETSNLITLNGSFDIISDELIIDVYKNFTNIKEINVEKLEESLELAKNEPSLKAYVKLSEYFSAENYFVNNNVFKLLKHRDESIKLAKKVLLKSIVAWQIRK